MTTHADLTPDRRLHATGGQARTLYAELIGTLQRGRIPKAVPCRAGRALRDHGPAGRGCARGQDERA